MIRAIAVKVTLITALVAGLFVSGTAAQGSPMQNEEPNVAGEWKTLSLTQNRIGYELRLRKGGAGQSTYQGTLQFRHRDGRKTKAIKVGLAVGSEFKNSYRVTIVMPGGTLATGERTVSGRLYKSDSSIYFPKCSNIWPLAMKGEEDTDCLFREMPN